MEPCFSSCRSDSLNALGFSPDWSVRQAAWGDFSCLLFLEPSSSGPGSILGDFFFSLAHSLPLLDLVAARHEVARELARRIGGTGRNFLIPGFCGNSGGRNRRMRRALAGLSFLREEL